MNLKGKKINFLGDSITEGLAVAEPSLRLVPMMKSVCELAEARNYGEGGTRIARQIEMNDTPYDHDFNMRVEDMDTDCDIVVVFGGTNDFGHGQAPLGKMEDRTVYTFYGALHTLITSLIKRFIHGEIVFITPLHRHNDYSMQGTWKPEGVEQRPLCDYVDAIKEVCKYYSVPVLDLFSSGGLHGNMWEWCKEYMPDGLHPNERGNRIIVNRLKGFLEQL